MKQCPSCKTQYTDDTLQYCLQDGTPLTAISVPGIPIDETETVISNRTRGQRADLTEISARPRSEEVEGRRSSTVLIVLLTVLATLLVFAIGIAGYLTYVRQRQKEDARLTPNNGAPGVNTTAAPVNRPTPTLTPTPKPTPTATPVNRAEATRAVSDAVAAWNSDTESGNIDAVARRYADTVDYFRTSGASREAVRRDKERAFSAFNSIEINISNVKIDVDDSGGAATAEFDKSWRFEGERVSEGRVRSQLKFRKINGKWLITSEKDLAVY